MKTSQLLALMLALTALCLPACNTHEEQPEQEHHKIVVTTPKLMDVDITQQYVCQIHSQRHIQIRALQDGYLLEIKVKEGQRVQKDDVLFRILPTLYKAKLDTELAEVKVAELDLQFTDMLAKKQGVSKNEVALYEAKLKRAEAKAKLAKAELDFTVVKAPFDGIIDRLHEQQGSLIKERDILTTLSDNSVMWVYFNVPEARYYDYMESTPEEKQAQRIELMQANGRKYGYPGNFRPFDNSDPAGAIEAKFNNENGNIAFRADFPNPDRLLRHGMTGSILIHRPLKNALVIPQRATFEILDRRYVLVVDDKDVVHQREISVDHELPNIYVIKGLSVKDKVVKGLSVKDKIIFEGIRQVRDGHKVEDYELRPVEQILENQSFHAE